MTKKTIKRSVLVKLADVLELICLDEDAGGAAIGDIRRRVSQIASDEEMTLLRAYCAAASEYEIIEDLTKQ